MNESLLIICVLFPILFGSITPIVCKKKSNILYPYVGLITIITSIFAWLLIILCKEGTFTLINFSSALSLSLKFDNVGRFFAGIVATLWPITVLYASEYMKHEERLPQFYAFFTISFGVTLGVTFAANIFTLYLFYEMLTLATAPLVMHTMTKGAVRATKKYFAYSLGGAAFAFASVVYLTSFGANTFNFGGFIPGDEEINKFLMQLFYVFGFFGFGVKAALFPLHGWLPKASVAPTPVTALLHAVAVVKSGAFAIIRLTFYSFNYELLNRSNAQIICMSFAAFTILFGAIKAVKEQHFKRRLAYSTVANLSYILFSISIMTKWSLVAALLHMAFHAEIKILAFFCAGAVLHNTNKEYLHELGGLGKKMPITFVSFTISALALTGIPPFSGFISKWYILESAAKSENVFAYVGAIVLLIAALLTAIYMFTVVCKVWFPNKDDALDGNAIKEVNLKMTIPMVLLSISILMTGIFANGILNAAMQIVGL